MAKSAREKIKLVSSEGTGHYYTTTKNKRNMPDKMEMSKYDPVVRKHVMYKEARSNNQYTDPAMAGSVVLRLLQAIRLQRPRKFL